MKSALFALAAAVALPVGAQAVTLNDYNYGTVELSPGESQTISFELDDLYLIDFISITGNGFSYGNDLSLVTITIDGTDYTFDEIEGYGNVANSTVFEPGFTTDSDFDITFSYDSEGTLPVLITYAFTSELAAVPLPAGGLLLAGALGSFFVARRRKKAADGNRMAMAA